MASSLRAPAQPPGGAPSPRAPQEQPPRPLPELPVGARAVVVAVDAGSDVGGRLRDLVVRVLAAGEDPDRVRLRDVMSGSPVFLGDARTLDVVIQTMREQGVRRIPVVDEQGELEGILTLDDLLVLLAEQLGSLAETVRQEISGRA